MCLFVESKTSECCVWTLGVAHLSRIRAVTGAWLSATRRLIGVLTYKILIDRLINCCSITMVTWDTYIEWVGLPLLAFWGQHYHNKSEANHDQLRNRSQRAINWQAWYLLEVHYAAQRKSSKAEYRKFSIIAKLSIKFHALYIDLHRSQARACLASR